MNQLYRHHLQNEHDIICMYLPLKYILMSSQTKDLAQRRIQPKVPTVIEVDTILPEIFSICTWFFLWRKSAKIPALVSGMSPEMYALDRWYLLSQHVVNSPCLVVVPMVKAMRVLDIFGPGHELANKNRTLCSKLCPHVDRRLGHVISYLLTKSAFLCSTAFPDIIVTTDHYYCCRRVLDGHPLVH